MSTLNSLSQAQQAPPPAAAAVAAPGTQSGLPYPINPDSAPIYPGLATFMGMELTQEVIRANMPEYLQGETVATVVRKQGTLCSS